MPHSTAGESSLAAVPDAGAIPFVQEFSAEVRAALLVNSDTKILQKGERLLTVGEHPKNLAIIINGMIELCGTETDDDCGVLLLTDCDLVTPMAVVFDEPCLTSATALMTTRVLLVSRAAVVKQAREHPEVALALARTMGAQWRMAVRHLIDIKTRTAGERLAAFLLRYVDHSENERTFLPFSKGALAARLGVKPETLSRVIQAVAANGIILRGSRIIIRDRVKAERFCGPDPYPKADEIRQNVHAL